MVIEMQSQRRRRSQRQAYLRSRRWLN